MNQKINKYMLNKTNNNSILMTNEEYDERLYFQMLDATEEDLKDPKFLVQIAEGLDIQLPKKYEDILTHRDLNIEDHDPNFYDYYYKRYCRHLSRLERNK